MRLYTSDEKRTVDVGTGSLWYSLYSTVVVTTSENIKNMIPLALAFLKNGDCPASGIKETKEQIIAVRSLLAELKPDKAVYDLHKPNDAPPWAGNIAPTVTSCANLYTTADGKDLLTEVIALLEYADEHNLPVFAG